MAKGTLTANGSTDWYKVNAQDGVHISGKGTFDGGTITVQHYLEGTAYSALDSAGVAITYAAAFDSLIDFRYNDIIRLALSSSTSPDLDWSITGRVEKVTV